MPEDVSRKHISVRFIWFGFLALVFSVSIVTPIAYFQYARISLPDFLFPPIALLFLITVLTGKISFRWHKFYLLLLFYFAAMLVSSVFSINPKASFIKLTGEIYLLGLAVLTFNLVRNERDFKQAVAAWLGGTSLAILVGMATIFLFYFHRDNWILEYTTHHYGAVPVGNFPRLSSTFYSASMFCNALNVSLILLLVAEKLQSIGKKLFYFLFFSGSICAAFTVSAGLGGIFLAIGGFFWLKFRETKKLLANAAIFGSAAIAVLFLIVNFFALQKYPDAPYTIKIPVLETELLPSPRLLIWQESFLTFRDNFLNGIGLDQDVCRVAFQTTDGSRSLLTDAHNIFLSVAAQNGIFGLLAILAITFYFVRKFSLSSFNKNSGFFLTNSLALAFICAFFYQGLTGSFEDSRHLWVLIGLILSAESLEKCEI